MFGGFDDVIVFEKDSEPCKDAELVSKLFQAGVLEETSAKDLVANILQIERCGVHEREAHDEGHGTGHLSLRSPKPSSAPSEAGADKED